MKRIFAYMRIELKKGIKIIPFFIQSFLITAAVLVLAVFFICQFLLQSQTFTKMKIGIVIPEEETSTEMVMKLVSGMESVDSICEFIYLEEPEAEEELAQGNLEAVILLTEDFYNDINAGINTPVKILLAPDSLADEVVFKELIRSGVSMLQTAQAAVYALDDAAREYTLTMSKNDMEYEISYLYLEYAFRRGNTFAETEMMPLGDVGLAEFYTACFAVVLSGIFGFGFLAFYRRENRDFSRCLRRIGVNAGIESLIRIFVMALDLWIVLAGCWLVGNTGYARLTGSSLYIFPEQIAGLFLYALAQAAFMHCIFAVFGNAENGGLIYLLLMIFMFISAGGILPISYFPVWMQKMSRVFPLVCWQNYFIQLMWTKVEMKTVITLLVVSFLFGGAGTVVLYEKSRK